ncbi:MAG: RNA polymerase sigma-70 factor [Tannerella sp.]|jgi:RNA polymerase sigma-70 factor (ECF subfamily)|nr:RNA polymerase sigma-70 factor [Tannerella sp.]
MKTPIDMEKVRQGDRTAFRDFFACFYPRLMALACRFVDEDAANDVVQDVFASYWERKHTIEADNIQSFLFKWVQNHCLNYIKHRMVVEEYEAQVRLANARVVFLENMSDANDTLRQLMSRNLLEVVEEAVRKLPPKCAQAFRLCYFEDFSHKEIAETMHISPRTVEGHIRQAILFLRDELRNVWMIVVLF